MNFQRIIISILVVSFAALQCAVAEESGGQQVSCPKIIADKDQGTFGDTSKGRYECYRNAKAAKRRGFVNPKAASLLNFTGWYRLTVNKTVKNTCGSLFGAGGTFFLQIRQNDAGVYGEFCPRTGGFTGTRTENGIILSSTNTSAKVAGSTLCSAGSIEAHQIIELERVVEGGPIYTARYRVSYRCLDPSEGANTCVEEVEGVAFPETHEIWKEVGVSENLTELAPKCGYALTKCQDCHPELKP